MKVKILGDWTLIHAGERKTNKSEPFDITDDAARAYARRLMVEIIPTEAPKEEKKNGKADA